MAATKPLIGVNTDYRSARKDTPAFAFLASGYFDALLEVAEESDTDRPRLVEVRGFVSAHSVEAA